MVLTTTSNEIFSCIGEEIRKAQRVDGAHGGDGVAFDARNLHESAHGVARKAEVVLHSDLGSVFNLV